MTFDRPLRLLLLAAACDPDDVGEAWSVFQWTRRLAEFHDVTLLTGGSRGKAHPGLRLPGVRVLHWEEWPVVSRYRRFCSMFKPGYLRFYPAARRWLKAAIARGERFDLAHQLSPLALRYPSPAAGLGLPLVLGPLGGSLTAPTAFEREASRPAWYTRLRAVDRWRIQHDPFLRRTLCDADVVLGVAPYVRELLNGVPIRRFEVMSETGVVDLPPVEAKPAAADGTKYVLFVGRVIRAKGVRDAIRALAQLENPGNVRFDVVGDGDDRAQCELECKALGVADRVTFHGWLPRDAVSKFYSRSHIFLFPSYREPSGNAVLEAMSHGLAAIVADCGGPAAAVTPGCGIRVKPSDPAQYAKGLAAALSSLLAKPCAMSEMGAAARQRVQEVFFWDRKVEWISQLYRDVLCDCSDRSCVHKRPLQCQPCAQ